MLFQTCFISYVLLYLQFCFSLLTTAPPTSDPSIFFANLFLFVSLQFCVHLAILRSHQLSTPGHVPEMGLGREDLLGFWWVRGRPIEMGTKRLIEDWDACRGRLQSEDLAELLLRKATTSSSISHTKSNIDNIIIKSSKYMQVCM